MLLCWGGCRASHAAQVGAHCLILSWFLFALMRSAGAEGNLRARSKTELSSCFSNLLLSGVDLPKITLQLHLAALLPCSPHTKPKYTVFSCLAAPQTADPRSGLCFFLMADQSCSQQRDPEALMRSVCCSTMIYCRANREGSLGEVSVTFKLLSICFNLSGQGCVVPAVFPQVSSPSCGTTAFFGVCLGEDLAIIPRDFPDQSSSEQPS